MNKQEFSNRLSVKLDKTKKEASLITDMFLQTLRESLIEEGSVKFSGDFSLEIKDTNPRVCRNPATGEEINVPAGKKIRFKAGKLLKDMISS